MLDSISAVAAEKKFEGFEKRGKRKGASFEQSSHTRSTIG
jgi:hypothetical protein